MSFFNFSPGSSAPGGSVSNWLWLYFAITVPITVIIYLAWRLWTRTKRTGDKDEEFLLGDIEYNSTEQGSRTNESPFWGLGYRDPKDLLAKESIWK